MKGSVIATFTDKFGEERKIRKTGRALRVGKNTDTPSHKANRSAATLIGQKIREKRLEKGWTVAFLCERSGLVSATPKERMWEIENAVRQGGLRMGTLYAIAAALGCEAADLLPATSDVMASANVTMRCDIVQALR